MTKKTTTLGILVLLAATASAGTTKVGPGESIQDAIDQADAGDTIVVSGVHYENVIIDVPGLTLKGPKGKDGTIDGQYLGPCVEVTADDVTITRLRLINGSIGVFAFGADRLSLIANLIRGTKLYNIDLWGDDALIRNNELRRGGGVYYTSQTSGSETRFEENLVRNCGLVWLSFGHLVVRNNELEASGLKIEGNHPSKNSEVLENVVSLSAIHGVRVTAAGLGVLVKQNHVRHCEGGIRIDAIGNGSAEVRKNTITDIGGDGLYVSHSSSGLVSTFGNSVSDAAGHGIEVKLNATGDLTLRGDHVDSCADRGIEVYAGTNATGTALVEDAEIKAPNDDGIYFYNHNSLATITIKGCEVRDGTALGIFCFGHDHTVTGNDVRGCVSSGIFLHADDSTVSANVVRKCGDNGISVTPINTFGGSTITNNVIKKCGRDGILVTGDAAHTVTDNECLQNKGDGIDVDSGSLCIVTGNTCLGNAHEGIDNSGGNTFLKDNEAFGNGAGLGPDLAGKGDGSGSTAAASSGNKFGTGGLTVEQRLDQ